MPLLAIAAYATVLRIGFLSDDFIFLYNSRESGLDLGVFVPEPHWYLYRPLGVVLVGQLGWQLWGYDPVGYHLVGLLLHAGSSLLLGLLAAEISLRRALGWLAGALFAVFPLHLEAVGWMSAQWDAWSVLFALASLWFFIIWWRRGNSISRRPVYLLFAALLYCLAIFTKENLLSFIVIFPVAAYTMNSRSDEASRFNSRDWQRLVLALIPLIAVLMLNIGIRLSAWGFIGGYQGVGSDYLNFFWDAYVVLIRMLLAPINSTVLGNATAQVVGALSCVGLLVGLVYFGYSERRLLLLGAAWVVVPLIPILNLSASLTDLQQNRFLYMASAGYCFSVAVLLYGFVSRVNRWRNAVLAVVGLITLGSVAVCWVQLHPWHTASVQVEDIDRQLSALLPPVQPGEEMVWFSENTPDNYMGAYLLRLGLGTLPYFKSGQSVTVNSVTSATELHGLDKHNNAFAMRFRFDKRSTRYVVDYVSGITSEEAAPTPSESTQALQVWTFLGCPPTADDWKVLEAESSCEPERGLTFSPVGGDPQVLGPPLSISSESDAARFVRVRASVIYPPADQPEPYISEWYWKGSEEEWSAERSLAMPIKQDGVPHVYWTFIPAEMALQGIQSLRFDPVNGEVDATVQWIAVDEVR